jgi:SpoIID/LytB domain protein
VSPKAPFRAQEGVLNRRHSRVRHALVATVAILAAAVVASVTPSRPAAAADNFPLPASGSYALSGHGFGHGRGMSQWGAFGMATEGQTASQILDFYYPGTQTTTIANPTIRVNLGGADGNDLTIAAGLGNQWLLDNGNGGARVDLPATVNGAAVSRWQVAQTPARTLALSGFWQNAWHPYPTAAPLVTSGPVRFASDSGTLRMVYPDNTSQEYQGFLDALIDGNLLRAIDTLPIEQYLDGVVPHEAINSWPAAALQAQAVAARSYADARLGGAVYDICDTAQCQVFSGVARYDANGVRTALQFPESNAAVAATAGQIRTYAGKVISAEYSSSNGGWTVDGGVPYKIAQPDPFDHYAPDHDWTTTLSEGAIEAAYPSIGTLSSIQVNQRDGNGDWGGRVLSVTVVGSITSVTVSGDSFRSAMGLKSTWWTITGAATVPVNAGYLHPVTPARILDTRTGGNSGFQQGETRAVQVAGLGGVPSDAVGAVLNVTATDTTSSSYLTVWPSSAKRPGTSNLNWDHKGQTVANLVYTALGSDGRVLIYNNNATASIIVDVFGYFEPTSVAGGLGFVPVTPNRVLDTRFAIGGATAPIGAHQTRTVAVAGTPGVDPAAQAVITNLTVTRPTAESYLTMWPAGTTQPATSNINMLPKDTRANAALGMLGDGGLSLYNNLGQADAIIDVMGEYLPADGITGQYVGISPSRLLDTRTPVGAHQRPMDPGETLSLAVLGHGGVPSSGVSGVVLNITAVAPSAPTFVTAWASGGVRPGISNLNAGPGTVVPNLVVTALGPDGKVNVYNDRGATNVIVDVVGWMAG